MRVLVTGAGGFIGSVLVRRLIAEGHEVHCLVHHARDRLLRLNAQVVQGDVTSPETLRPAVEGVDIVFHLAARSSDWGSRELFMRINAGGTQNLLDAAIASGVKRFVLMSSLAVHRFIGYVDADETAPADQDHYPYGASKVAAERVVTAARDAGRIATTIVRPGVVVHGPEDTISFINMAPVLKTGIWLHVGGGKPLMCYSYVENLADGLILAGTLPLAAGETFIITDDLRMTWAQYISTLMSIFNVKERNLSVPVPIARFLGITAEMLFRLLRSKNPPAITDYRTALVSRDFHFSCEKAKHKLGYIPKVPFEEGLKRTVEWYRHLSKNMIS
jgi:nucleoside-diphosphate-sugar epimerase